MEKGSWHVVGAMSGSSLDGLDLALCRFEERNGHWGFDLLRATTIPFEPSLHDRLGSAMDANGLELARLHRDLGRFIGERCRDLLAGENADLIGSHGHTVFHRPEEGLTLQIGCGAHIATMAGLPVVTDFRTKDVAFGGQGAPLVPMGERHLFPEHQVFVNLGGIANISLHGPDRVTGHDIAPCNQPLNRLAEQAGHPYDKDGSLAAAGKIVEPLLAQLEGLAFYRQSPPRSLGREWFEAEILPLINNDRIPLNDRLRTVTEHIALRVADALDRTPVPAALFTGGGTRNGFLLERIGARTSRRIDKPADPIIDHKEAIIFAFLGLLRWLCLPNALATVTGASGDSIGGAIHLPN